MRCPKCQYISYDSTDRCRNCGYELSLSDEEQPLDLAIQRGDEALGPMNDLPLGEPLRGRSTAADPTPPSLSPSSRIHATAASRLDLPLFEDGETADDRPLVSPTSVPRPPLSVRRATPVIARPRSRAMPFPEEPELELDDLSEVDSDEAFERDNTAELRELARPAVDPAIPSAVSRLTAGLLDLLILGSIDAAVVYLTLRVCGLGRGDLLLLPMVPLVAFLFLLNGGYLVIFTAAGGQTIGKMTTGIRVVGHDERGMPVRASFGSAVVRAAAYFASALPAGAGFAPILFSDDGRTLHDRLSDTRVVRA